MASKWSDFASFAVRGSSRPRTNGKGEIQMAVFIVALCVLAALPIHFAVTRPIARRLGLV